MTNRVIAIDGPAGAGKSEVAKGVAKALGMQVLNTGLLYRAIAWQVDQLGIPFGDEVACTTIAREIKLGVVVDGIKVNGGKTVSIGMLKTPYVSEGSSIVGSYAGVREALVSLQRQAVNVHGTVAEGRDMGTVIFPDAFVKIFLTAGRTEREARVTSAYGAANAKLSLERDARDASREVAPLMPAEDAYVIDSTFMDQGEVIGVIVALYTARAQQIRTEVWRQANAIVHELLGDEAEAILINAPSKGVRGDAPTWEETVMVRHSADLSGDILAKASDRLTNTILHIGRVTLDVTPP